MGKVNTPRSQQAGFSLLEALAAVAIIAAAFLPLMVLQNRLAESAIAIERTELTIKARSAALGYLQSINPMMRPSGEDRIGDARLTWQARPITDALQARDRGGGEGRFIVQLFEIEAELVFKNGQRTSFVVKVTGWRPTSPFGNAF